MSNPDRLQLTIDGISDIVWFRQREFLEKIGVKVKPQTQINRGIKQ